MKKIIIYYLNKHKLSEIGCIILMGLNACFSLGSSFLMIELIDCLTTSFEIENFVFMLFLYMLFIISSEFITSVSNVYYYKLSNIISMDIKKNIVDNWFWSSGSVFTNSRNGELLETLSGDTEELSTLLTETFFSTINSFITACFMIVYLGFLQWDLLIIVLALQFIMIPMQGYFGKKIYKASEESRRNIGVIESDTQELLTNILRFIGGGLHNFFRAKYSESLKKGYHSGVKVTKLWNQNNFFCNLISVLVLVVVLGFGGWKISVGKMTVGILVVFIQNSQGMFQPIFQLSNLRVELEKIKPSLERIEKNCKIFNNTEKQVVPKTIKISNISLKDVTFFYNEEQVILKNTSISFEKGHIYALLGESGAGKSTLFNLLLKLWPINNGDIFINNKKIEDWKTEDLRKSICYIAQEDFILNMSVRDNIALDDVSITNQEVQEAAKLACLEDFTIEDRIHNIIGENGCTISGGQRQRISLARMFVSNASVILMDEPTAALDTQRTVRIMENIRERCKEKIIIIITHSELVTSYCDDIIMLENGNFIKKSKE